MKITANDLGKHAQDVLYSHRRTPPSNRHLEHLDEGRPVVGPRNVERALAHEPGGGHWVGTGLVDERRRARPSVRACREAQRRQPVLPPGVDLEVRVTTYVENKAALTSASSASRRHTQWQMQA